MPKTPTLVLRLASCLSPYRAPEAPRGGNPRKMGKNYKIPLAGPAPENGEKLPKNYKKCIFGVFFVIFRYFSPIFRGWTGEGNFVIFPHFSGISAPGGFRGSVRGKTTRNLRPLENLRWSRCSGKKEAHKLEKLLETPARCPWDTRRDKRGSTGRCPGDFLLFIIETWQKRAFLLGHRPGVPGLRAV